MHINLMLVFNRVANKTDVKHKERVGDAHELSRETHVVEVEMQTLQVMELLDAVQRLQMVVI